MAVNEELRAKITEGEIDLDYSPKRHGHGSLKRGVKRKDSTHSNMSRRSAYHYKDHKIVKSSTPKLPPKLSVQHIATI